MHDRMRSLIRAMGRTAVPALLLFAAACASSGRGASVEGIRIMVRNNLTPSLNVSISAVVDGASPVRLGSLVAGESQTFTYRPIQASGTFRLMADRPGPGRALFSEPIPFPVETGTTIEWELNTNNILLQ